MVSKILLILFGTVVIGMNVIMFFTPVHVEKAYFFEKKGEKYAILFQKEKYLFITQKFNKYIGPETQSENLTVKDIKIEYKGKSTLLIQDEWIELKKIPVGSKVVMTQLQ